MITQWRSFEEWSKLGYKIQKGSKATWIDNKPVFCFNDLEDKKLYNHSVYIDPDMAYLDPDPRVDW